MAEFDPDIEMLAIFSHRGAGNDIKKRSILEGSELNDVIPGFENLLKQKIMGEGQIKGILNVERGTNARIHRFSNGTVRSVCEGMRQAGNLGSFELYAKDLAKKYQNTPRSQSAVLNFLRVQMLGKRFIVIFFFEYPKDVATFSETGIIRFLSGVFSQEMKKGIIYPYRDSKGLLHTDRAKVYQKENYADYWWKFFDLQEAESNEEILIREIREEETARRTRIEIDRAHVTGYVEDEEEKAGSRVSLICDDIVIRSEFGRLYDRIIPTRKNGKIRIVVKGESCLLKVPGFESRDIKDYEDYDEI